MAETDVQTAAVVAAAIELVAARRAFIALPSNSPDARAFLNRLAEAESALVAAVDSATPQTEKDE